MLLTQLFTQASREVEIEFRAMERSLRATGCDLPLRVIPFNESLFDLPKNATWWKPDGSLLALTKLATHPCHLRYAVLTQSNYQYADTDIIFLRNPSEVLAEHSGFVATCTQWRLPEFAVCPLSEKWFRQRSSTWPLMIFNSGQFASETSIYEPHELIHAISSSDFTGVIFLKDAPWDQPGFNLLVHLSKVAVRNLTLPPFCLPSSWAGDYGDNYRSLWETWKQTPYLIHWAGGCLYRDLAINELFYDFLTNEERVLFEEKRRFRNSENLRRYRQSLPLGKRAVYEARRIASRLVNRLVHNR